MGGLGWVCGLCGAGVVFAYIGGEYETATHTDNSGYSDVSWV